MQCPKCDHENKAAARFCESCGAKLLRLCPSCGEEVSPHARFCSACGASLADGADSKVDSPDPASAHDHDSPFDKPVLSAVEGLRAGSARLTTEEGERRQLTVLFCDLVGSTEIASQLDPEDWHRISKKYQHAAADAVRRFGGHVDKFLGDGLVCFFGVPQAHEDDAERAVRAGLAIVEAVRVLNRDLGARPSWPHDGRLEACAPSALHVRVGMHTGPAVVAHGGGESKDVFGDTPNIAARVHAVAQPDTVVITAATHRLVSGLFVVDDLGAHTLKGVREPTQLYRVLQGSGVRGRLHAAAARGLTPFVGREDERRLLPTSRSPKASTPAT